MSNEALTAVAKSEIRPSGRKFVAMALADYADEAWSCFPSVAQLASYTGQGEKTVRDHLDALESDGVISRERQRRDDGTMGRYRFKLQRRNLPVAEIASGEKHPQPAADFATHNPQREPSSIVKSASEFDAWYASYPHKVQRGAAERAFPKARAVASLDELIDGVQRYVASKPLDRQWQNPATWLNGKGWLDSPAAIAPQARGSPPQIPNQADVFAFMGKRLDDGQEREDRSGAREASPHLREIAGR